MHAGRGPTASSKDETACWGVVLGWTRSSRNDSLNERVVLEREAVLDLEVHQVTKYWVATASWALASSPTTRSSSPTKVAPAHLVFVVIAKVGVELADDPCRSGQLGGPGDRREVLPRRSRRRSE